MIKNHDRNYQSHHAARDTMAGTEWLDIYDALQGYWLHNGTVRGRAGNRLSPGRYEDGHFRLIQAVWRCMRRRHQPALPVRDRFKSTVDYYNAMMPLLVAQRHVEQTSSSWRYVRPMMVRVLFLGWPSYRKPR